MSLASLLEELLSREPEPAPVDGLAQWWSQHRCLEDPRPATRATLGGFLADRLGWAFASGYQSAGEALFGDGSPSDQLAALCATEQGGAHPRAIECRLVEDATGRLRLNGEKRFVTFGTEARTLLVVASVGQTEEGRNALRMVKIDPRPGVEIHPLKPTPFCPEIPHARLSLREVAVAQEEVLPGDGYLRYLKPFRTVEDIHVHLALLGWLVQVGRRSHWSPDRLQALLTIIASLHGLASAEPLAPAVHLALAGALEQTASLLDALEWSRVDEDTRRLWERDHALLSVAQTARDRRRAAAWARLTAEEP